MRPDPGRRGPGRPALRPRKRASRQHLVQASGGQGGGAQLCFHVQAGGYDTLSLIGVLGQLRRFLGGQKATLLWDGLGPHRSRAMRAPS
jgi:hypothetical protein